jgi:hypothetical protein
MDAGDALPDPESDNGAMLRQECASCADPEGLFTIWCDTNTGTYRTECAACGQVFSLAGERVT